MFGAELRHVDPAGRLQPTKPAARARARPGGGAGWATRGLAGIGRRAGQTVHGAVGGATGVTLQKQHGCFQRKVSLL